MHASPIHVRRRHASMDSMVCVIHLVLAVSLALAGPIIAGGSTEEVGLARKQADEAYAARQMTAQATTTASTMGKEVHRRVLGSINPSTLDPDKPACLGSCPAAGRPYTGRGCQKAYQCSS
jgi:hypothetical protein|uniref:Uncharacterized protein n=2 Tax=Zea mays TaxID=4577 RepID=A0A804MI67_MAIZE